MYFGSYLPETVGNVIYRSDLLSLMDAIKYFPIYSIKLPIKLFPIKIPISYTRLEVLVDAVAVMTTVAAAVSVTAGGGAMPVPPPPVPPPRPHRPRESVDKCHL